MIIGQNHGASTHAVQYLSCHVLQLSVRELCKYGAEAKAVAQDECAVMTCIKFFELTFLVDRQHSFVRAMNAGEEKGDKKRYGTGKGFDARLRWALC